MTLRKSAKAENRLLSRLPRKAFSILEKDLEEVPLELRQDLSQAAGRITHVYFPLRGMVSLLPKFQDGTSIEVGLVGPEGFLGVSLLLAGQGAAISAIVHEPGRALRMEAGAFCQAAAQCGSFQRILLGYAQALLLQITRTAMCNARHTVAQRLGRWLLEAHDRVGGNEISLSHELLSRILGARRAGVTTALGEYSARGLVDSARQGVLRIRSRAGIERSACKCYRSLRKELRTLAAHARTGAGASS